MNEDYKFNYERISKTINFIKNNFKDQPSLNEMAENLNLNAHHFQKIFKQWIGISPKKYLQYITLECAKEILSNNEISLLDTSYEVGLSSSSRLYDLFMNTDGITPGNFKTQGENLLVYYNLMPTPLGNLLVASTKKGICSIAFYENEKDALFSLKMTFKNASFIKIEDDIQEKAFSIFNNVKNINYVKFQLNNSPYQIKIWESLLKIEIKDLIAYCEIGKKVNNPNLSIATSSYIHKETIRFNVS